ncbi:hypothetical protein [Acinetobacter bereziniae]|uniref:hypothetical protein n=1 Tax=Acinetobacter bereziniae TaxID=106648 RepID=UPI001900D433|nr:hypothetical protein [Acinetobacter bereziniae]MBJ8445880.1 hypothetical protein [Acinetobacter bereziniae]
MKKIIFIFCIVSSSTTFANTYSDPDSTSNSCKYISELAKSIQTLRQRGMTASEISDKVIQALSEVKNNIEKQADETNDNEKKAKIFEIADQYTKALKAYGLVAVQEVFLEPIKPTQQLKDKAIKDYTNEQYLACLENAVDK